MGWGLGHTLYPRSKTLVSKCNNLNHDPSFGIRYTTEVINILQDFNNASAYAQDPGSGNESIALLDGGSLMRG